MLRDARMAANRKLHCGIELGGQRQVWAVSFGAILAQPVDAATDLTAAKSPLYPLLQSA